MKIITMALAAAMMFVSCSKENTADNSGSKPGEKTSVTITIKGNSDGNSKADGIPATDTENEIKDYLVYLFRGDGTLDCPAFLVSDGATTTKIGNATTAAVKAYVVANTGAKLVDGKLVGMFKDVKKEADIEGVFGDLQAADQKAGNLWMSGFGKVDHTEGKDENQAPVFTGKATVSLNFVTARIALTVVDKRENKNGPNISIKDNSIVLLFAGKKGLFFGSKENKEKQDGFYSGDKTYNINASADLWEAGLKTDIVATGFDEESEEDTKNKYHFYTFGNDAKNRPTVLAIRSTKTEKDKTPYVVYFPVTFKLEDAKTTIEPGKSYNVRITLKGDINNGEGGGTPDPEDPVISSKVDITVEAAKWNPVLVTKDFN